MSDSEHLFFRLDPQQASDPGALATLRDVQPDYQASFWRPGIARPFPPGRYDPRIWSYSLMSAFGMFGTPDYGALLLRDRDGSIVHSSLIMPRFARFPFMGRKDLQIGATFTAPACRGRGLALRAVHEILAELHAPDRAFWYLTDHSNTASIRVIEKAGFRLVGTGKKMPRMGLKFFGFYDMSAVENGRTLSGSG